MKLLTTLTGPTVYFNVHGVLKVKKKEERKTRGERAREEMSREREEKRRETEQEREFL